MQNIPVRKLSVVIPVFNERNTVQETINKVIRAQLPAGWQREVVIIDDGSTDGTCEILRGIHDERCRVILRAKNGGKGAALKDGFKATTGDFIIIQDADSEYDPADYVTLLRPIIENKTEVVFGSRVLAKNNIPFSRVYFYGGLIITKIFNLFFGNKITDLATCYKIFPRKYVDELVKMPADDFVFDVVELSYFLLRKVKHITEVPIKYLSRHKEEGKKMNWRHGYRCFRRILSLFISEKFSHAWNKIIDDQTDGKL